MIMKILLLFFVLVWRTVEAKILGDVVSELDKTSYSPAVNITTGSSSICSTALQTYNNSGSTAYEVGETIQLACSLATLNTPFNISLFYLLHHGTGERLEPSFREDNQAVFEIQSASRNDDGTYECYYGDCTQHNPDYTSFKDIKIIDVSKPKLECVGSNYNWSAYNISCTWSRNDDTYSSAWLLQYVLKSLWSETLQPFQNCTSETNSPYVPSQSCSFMVHHFWTVYNFMTFQFHLKEKLWIVDRSFNAEFNYTVPVNASIVKLNPVLELNSSADQPREMTLSWRFDGSSQMIGELCSAYIYYWSTDERSKNMSEILLVNTTSFVSKTLTDLEPFTVYNFEVRVRPSTSPYWSDPAVAEGQTLPEAPAGVPTEVGYTSQELVQNDSWREIFLYWEVSLGDNEDNLKFSDELAALEHLEKSPYTYNGRNVVTTLDLSFLNGSSSFLQPLPPRSWNGPNGSYIVNVTCEKCLPLTEEFPANSSVYTTKLADNLLSYKAYELTIQTKNSVGLTEKISKVYIPELEKDNKPDLVKYEEREPDVFDVVVMDTRSRSPGVNYTLYWCQGYSQKIPFCVGNYNSRQSSEKNFTIILNQSVGHYPWFFGAAVEDGDQSNSIVWAGDQSYRTSPLKVPLEEDDSKIGITLGFTIGGILLVAILIFLVYIIHHKLSERMKEHEIKDIIIVTDQIRNDIHQTETDSEESVSLTDSVTPDDIDIVPEDRPPHCYGLQDTDRPEILDENIMLVNPDNYITIGSDSPTGTRNGHLESESKYQDPNKEWIYVQTEVIATNNGVESKAVAQNGDFSMETVDDDDNEPEVGDYVHSDLVSNLDIPQIKTNNLTEIAEASENAESKMSIVDKKHNPSKLPAYLSDANFVGNGNVSNNAITELTEKEKTPEKSVDSYVHIATDIRNSDTKEGQEESLVKTEGVSDCVTETLLREPTSVEIEHMVPTCTQKHKEDEFDPFYVAENLTKVQGIRSSDRLVCNFTEQCSGYMEQDCKEIMKQTSTDISMIHRIDDSPYVDNIELMKIAMSKHLSGITVTFDCSCMANASIEVVKSTSTNLGNSLYNAHTALTGISNSNLSSGIENSYDASPKINQTSYRSESTDAANASSYVQHEIVDKIANKLLDEASGSTGSSYVTWGKVGQSVDRGVNTQDICPPYVVLNSDFGLTQAKPRELTADTAVETDSFKNEVIFDLPKPSMELHQTASIIKDSVPLGTLSQLILNKLEISRMGNSRTVRDGEKSICNNATVEGPKNADDSSSKEHETINVSESDRHATFGINDEGKYVAKVNDVDGGSKMNSYTKVCLAEIREEVSYQTDKNLV